MPKRIQRRRTKDWKMPPNCVYVGRPTIYGNCFREGGQLNGAMMPWVHEAARRFGISLNTPLTRRQSVQMFLAFMEENRVSHLGIHIREQLRGKDLACWCKIGAECHADILLELANQEPTN